MDWIWNVLERVLTLARRVAAKAHRVSVMGRFNRVGRNFVFVPFGSVFSAETIEIGDDVFMGELAYLGGVIKIGNRVMFGPHVTILGADHLFAVEGASVRFLKPEGLENARPVVIEDEVWIGANATVTGEVTIGMGSVIGAASVVVSDVPPFTIAVGNPAKPVRRIFDDKALARHLAKLGYSATIVQDVLKRRRRAGEVRLLPVVDNTSKTA